MNQNFSNIENGRARSLDRVTDLNPAALKAAYETPRLITHGSLRDLTLQDDPCAVSPQPEECGAV